MIVLLMGYIMYYFLVTFHVYAMVHPGQSGGYYNRYAYFFIPVFYIIIPLILYRTTSFIEQISLRLWGRRTIFCGIAVFLFFAYPSVLDNWHKANDEEFAEIWIHNARFKDTTYLIGGFVREAFDYHTSQYSYKLTGTVKLSDDIDLEQLPDSFWLWRSNWGGDMWNITLDAAIDQGYEVVIYADHGLAYCTR